MQCLTYLCLTPIKIESTIFGVFQGMNPNRRELHEHVKYEQNTYYGAFSAELEASASIMWALIAHLKDVVCNVCDK